MPFDELHTCVYHDIRIAILPVLQLQKITELSAIFLNCDSQVCKLPGTPHVLQEEAERVPTVPPVVEAVIPTQPRQHPHRCVGILSIIQVGSVWRTLLQGKTNNID